MIVTRPSFYSVDYRTFDNDPIIALAEGSLEQPSLSLFHILLYKFLEFQQTLAGLLTHRADKRFSVNLARTTAIIRIVFIFINVDY